MAQFAKIAALLIGSACLLFAGGINGLVLPLRGAEEGFSALSLGLLGTGWAVGYVSGCLFVPRLVGRVGHIRSFSVMAGLAAISILMSLLLIYAPAWIVLRALAGFCFAGAAMIVESWLNEQTEAQNRGKVFGVYTMVNLAASTLGQMSLTLGTADSHEFFVIGAIFYALALVPTATTRQNAPQPMRRPRLDLKALHRNSPLATIASVLVGVSNSAFGTLGAVYGNRIGLDVTAIASFMSLALVMGALFQVPIGALSDRMDRRFVLLGLAALALLVDLCFLILAPQSVWAVFTLIGAFGIAIFGMYPVIVAHASDHATPGAFLQTSGGLLLLFGAGSIGGPLLAGVIMSGIGPAGLFATTLIAHALLIAYGAYRISRRQAPKEEDKGNFRPAPFAATSTPQTMALASDAGQDLQPAQETADSDPRS